MNRDRTSRLLFATRSLARIVDVWPRIAVQAC